MFMLDEMTLLNKIRVNETVNIFEMCNYIPTYLYVIFLWLFSSSQNLDALEFPEIIPLLKPLMHCVCLVYSSSLYYNTPARIIVLMQETCNLLIESARKFMDPASLFQVFSLYHALGILKGKAWLVFLKIHAHLF